MMSQKNISLSCFLAGCLLLVQSSPDLRAHEGHAALPSTGVARDGNYLLISSTAVKAIGMKTEKIRLGDIEQTLRVSARTELPPTSIATVTTLAVGKVARVLVKPGDSVKSGQTLALVESLQLMTLQGELLQSAAEVAALKKQIKVREPLVLRGSIARKILLKDKADLREQQAQYAVTLQKLASLGVPRAAIAMLSKTGERVKHIPIVAPSSGRIRHVDARPGQLVSTTDHLFELVSVSTLFAVGEVVEGDAHLVRANLPVSLTLSGRDNIRINGQIDYIRLNIDEKRRSLAVVTRVNNREELLRPGMFGQMKIKVAAVKQGIVCPTSAVITTEGGEFVLKRESLGKFSRCRVRTGMRSRKLVVIESGLFPGQQVVSRGAFLLASMFDGVPWDKSKPANSPPATISPGRTRPAPQLLMDVVTAANARVEMPNSRRALAMSLIDGRVAAISVKSGQQVRPGDKLAEVESPQLRNLQLQLLQTAGRRQWFQGEVTRLRPLAMTGRSPKQVFRKRELELETHTLRVDGLKQRLTLIGLDRSVIQRLAQADLGGLKNHDVASDRIVIRAPIAGRVSKITMTLGQRVHVHDSLCEIQNTRTVWVKALVLDRDAARVSPKQQAVVTFAAHPNLRVTGRVIRIAPQLTSRERVLALWIELPNPSGLLRHGMLARVQVRVPKRSSSLATRTITAK